MLSNKKAQSTLEYALLISAVIAAFLAINLYLTRGVQGKLKGSADQLGDQFDPAGNFINSFQRQANSGTTSTQEVRVGGLGTAGDTTTTVTTSETMTKNEYEDWGTVPQQHY